jgi:hypothetical protein
MVAAPFPLKPRMSQRVFEDAVVLPSKLWPYLKLRENPSSRDRAEAENFPVDNAKYTLGVLTSFSPDGAAVAAQLCELLPKELDAVLREKMRQHGVASSALYRLRDGSGLSQENLERIAIALGRPDVVAGPGIPALELRDDVLRAANIAERHGRRGAAHSARAWCTRVADATLTGRTVQEFICQNCGNRLAMDVPNTFSETGACDRCGSITNIEVGCELSDLPDGIYELALELHRGRIETVREEARAKRVTPAAIRKRRSRARAVRAEVRTARGRPQPRS